MPVVCTIRKKLRLFEQLERKNEYACMVPPKDKEPLPGERVPPVSQPQEIASYSISRNSVGRARRGRFMYQRSARDLIPRLRQQSLIRHTIHLLARCLCCLAPCPLLCALPPMTKCILLSVFSLPCPRVHPSLQWMDLDDGMKAPFDAIILTHFFVSSFACPHAHPSLQWI